jgi:cysteine desulfurase
MNKRQDDIIYLDGHSTTPLASAVLEAMLPCLTTDFGNAGSHSHEFGLQARERVEDARQQVARFLAAESDEIVFTGGATESNNLAIFGAARRWLGKRRHLVTIGIEHPSVLEPLRQLEREGWRVSFVPVRHQVGSEGTGAEPVETTTEQPAGTAPRFALSDWGDTSGWPGQIDLSALAAELSAETALVSVALANNEVGVIQPLRAVTELAHAVGAWVHSDATQAMGWLPIDVTTLPVDLLSFSAHKFGGPKGVGGLYVRRRATYPGARPVRLVPQTVGGGQEFGLRSGTLNTAGIVGLGAALRLVQSERAELVGRVAGWRDRLWARLWREVPEVRLHGPDWRRGGPRLPNNINFGVPGIEGQTILLGAPGLAASSGSACSSASPGVSSVLTGIGLSEEAARCGVRVGLGRWLTEADIELAAERLVQAIALAREAG